MRFFVQFYAAILAYQSSLKTIDRHSLWSKIWKPVIFSGLIAILVGLLAWSSSQKIIHWVLSVWQLDNFDAYWQSFIRIAIIFGARGITLFLFLKIYRYLILILLFPFLIELFKTFLQTKINDHGYSLKTPFRIASQKSIPVIFRNLLYELGLSIGIVLIVFLISWILPLAPFMLMIVESYFWGAGLTAFKLNVDQIGPQEGSQFISQYKGAILGNGFMFNLLLLIPVLGVLFAPTLAVGALHETFIALEKEDNHEHSINQSIQQSTFKGV
ncbi:MAG: EI24 domain-containing protein [Candidatus Cyclobacteriaceae bacterium M3_2C_046]